MFITVPLIFSLFTNSCLKCGQGQSEEYWCSFWTCSARSSSPLDLQQTCVADAAGAHLKLVALIWQMSEAICCHFSREKGAVTNPECILTHPRWSTIWKPCICCHCVVIAAILNPCRNFRRSSRDSLFQCVHVNKFKPPFKRLWWKE